MHDTGKVIPITPVKPSRLHLRVNEGDASVDFAIERQAHGARPAPRQRLHSPPTGVIDIQRTTEKGTMKLNCYRIDDDQRVAVLQGNIASEGPVFATLEGLQALAGGWPANRLVQIWNALPGVTPVRRFTDRRTAIARIWRAVQRLEPTPAHAPPSSKRKSGSGEASPERTAGGQGSKADTVIALLRRDDGATMQELTRATGWQPHSVRGFLSGKVARRLGLQLESFRRERERVYRLPLDS